MSSRRYSRGFGVIAACAFVFVWGCPDTFQFTGFNQNPVADAGPDKTGTVGSSIVLDGTGSTDPDGDSLTYNWTQSYGEFVQISNANAMQASFVPPVEGTCEFTLTVSDGRGGSDSDVVRVNVGPGNGNRPPVAIATASPNPADAGQTVTLDGSGSYDPDSDPLVYAWVQLDGPSVQLSNGVARRPTFVAPEVSQETALAFQLTVDDGEVLSSPAEVQVVIMPGGGPSVAFRPAVGALFHFRGAAVEVFGTVVGAIVDAGSPVKGARIRLPNGETVTLTGTEPPDEAGPVGFYTGLPGLPEVEEVYLFEALDAHGNLIEGLTCEALYHGTRVDPPRSVQASIQGDSIVLTWSPVSPTTGFDPGRGVGRYSIEVFDQGNLVRSRATSDTHGAVSLASLPPGLYEVAVYASSQAGPASSCHPDELNDEDCTSRDESEMVTVQILPDGTIRIIDDHPMPTCGAVLLREDFEGCGGGTWIGSCNGWQTWANGSNGSAFFISDEQHVSGTHALQVAGAGSCWEGSAYKPVTSNHILAKASMRASGEGPIGCHRYQNGFSIHPVAVWSFDMPNGAYQGGLTCSANGGGQQVALDGFQNLVGRWYDVAIELDYASGMAYFWLNADLVFSTAFDTSVAVQSIWMRSGEGRGWFDDIVVCDLDEGYARYVISSRAYNSDTDDILSEIQADYGSAATLAEWDDIKAECGGSVAGIRQFMDEVGMSDYGADGSGGVYWVTCKGAEFWSDRRHYHVTRQNGAYYGWFLYHDDIQDRQMALGSWWGTFPALVRLPNGH